MKKYSIVTSHNKLDTEDYLCPTEQCCNYYYAPLTILTFQSLWIVNYSFFKNNPPFAK